jgi:hypothetical protein
MSTALTTVEIEEKTFELAQRKARVYSDSSLVPKEYQKNIGNVLIAQNMAQRMGADPLMVMQNLYIVHGKPGWSAQFLIACFNQCGRFAAIKYRFVGTPGKDDYGCVAYTTELASGDLIEGVCVTIGMAKAEGWHGKAGSKWKTIPDLMLCYRSATFLVRCTAPEIGLGIQTREEIYDTVEGAVTGRRSSTIESTSDLTALLGGSAGAIESAAERVDYGAALATANTQGALLLLRDRLEADGDIDSGEGAAVLQGISDRLAVLENE